MEGSTGSDSGKNPKKASSPRSPEIENNQDIGFEKQPMVDWFSQSQLVQTSLRAVLSSIFDSYSDKREIQSALTLGQNSHDIFDYSDRKELWINYVSVWGPVGTQPIPLPICRGEIVINMTYNNLQNFKYF